MKMFSEFMFGGKNIKYSKTSANKNYLTIFSFLKKSIKKSVFFLF